VLEPDPELTVAYGIFSARQAAGAGYSRADIKRQLRRGTWVRLDRGVFSVANRNARPSDVVQIDGWLMLRFTAADIRTNPDYVIGLIRLALARRGR
jgi:hypothetical protein